MTGVVMRRWTALVVVTLGAALVLGRAGASDDAPWERVGVGDVGAVESVVAAPDGALRVGTNAGLVRLDGWGQGGASMADLPTAHIADALAVDARGEVWVASLDGLVSGDGERWEHHAAADGLPEGPVNDVTPDGDRVWAATAHGVYRLEAERWQRLPDSPHGVGSLAVGEGTVWAAVDTVSDGEALFEFDGDRWTVHVTRGHARDGAVPDTEEVLPGRLVRDVDVGDDGVVWVGTDAGVAASDGEGWTRHTVEDGLPHGGVQTLTVGHDDDVWVATVEEGVPDPDHAVSRFDGRRWTTYTTEDGLPDAWVNDLTVSRDGSVWAATDAGLARLGEADG